MEWDEIEKYRKVQNIARLTIESIVRKIEVGASELEIFQEAKKSMLFFGKKYFPGKQLKWWYHNTPALVLIGEGRTLDSISGKVYEPDDDIILKPHDMFTIDLGPSVNRYWGDYARTLFADDNKIIKRPKNEEFLDGLKAEEMLHGYLFAIARPDMTYQELYISMTEFLHDLGYKNLDFNGNFGHSIQKKINARKYIDAETSNITLGERPFTFEPHIAKIGSLYGFKREDIYIFHDGELIRI